MSSPLVLAAAGSARDPMAMQVRPTVAPSTNPAHALSPARVTKLASQWGGQDLSLRVVENGIVELHWATGTDQIGYNVLRVAGGSLTILPTAGQLAASATSFTDPAPPPGLA